MQLPRPRLPPAPRNAGRVGTSTGDARENERRAQGGQSRKNRDTHVCKNGKPTTCRLDPSELPMETNPKDRNRPSVAVVAGVIDELKIARQVDAFRDAVFVISLQNMLTTVV